jgi:hypothetical protein
VSTHDNEQRTWIKDFHQDALCCLSQTNRSDVVFEIDSSADEGMKFRWGSFDALWAQFATERKELRLRPLFARVRAVIIVDQWQIFQRSARG